MNEEKQSFLEEFVEEMRVTLKDPKLKKEAQNLMRESAHINDAILRRVYY